MRKLIIADDEKWVRTTIKTIIPFEELNLTLCREASNGVEALELCRLHKPDILLTDIMMPGLNGLELISEVKTLLPSLRIAIISGYSDFEYAKTAMKYGITDYILKPVDEKELTQVLKRIMGELDEQDRLSRENEAEKEHYRRVLPVISEAFLNEVVSKNNMTAEKIRNEAKKYRIDFSLSSFTICVFSPDEELDFEGGAAKYEYCKAIIKRVMRRYAKAVTFPLGKDKSISVSVINHEKKADGIENAFYICNRLLQKKYSLSVSAGVSGSTRQPGMLQNLCADAVNALGNRFWSGPSTLGFHRQEHLSDDLKLSLPEDVLSKIVLNLKLSNITTGLSYIDSTFESLGSDSPRTDNGPAKTERSTAAAAGFSVKPVLVKEFYWQFIQSIIIMLNIQLPFIRHETTVTGSHPYDRIRKSIFLDDLKDRVKELLQHIYDFYHDKNPLDSNLIDNAKKIIEREFAGDISLEQVARHVHLSPSYLSELFKREAGMSFIDYKTITRIEHAKKMLLAPQASISEVSGKVGYSDPKYFSKLFKKITGKTIYEYRQEARGRLCGNSTPDT